MKNNSGKRFTAGALALLWLLTACTSGLVETPVPTPLVNTPVPTSGPATAQPTEPSPSATETQPEPPPPAVFDFPDPAQFTWQLVADGFEKPTDLAALPDDSGILLVVEQVGVIRILQDGVVSAKLFLNLTDRVDDSGSEQGLLGIALAPDYPDSGVFYLNYTDKNGDTIIARYHRMGDTIYGDPQSEEVLLKVDQPYANHNGGSLEFGPDGMLYIGLGDGGSGGDPQGNAQNPDTLLGKMLRLDVSGEGAYTIPADNPFTAGGGRQEIWALGLRNPWRYTFDRLTGDLYIADVGQNKYEEVHFLPAGSPGGANFGWDYREGLHAFEGNVPEGISPVDPVVEYDHGQGCSISGGYVYRGQALPEWSGIYLYGDYCSGLVWGLLRNDSGEWMSRQLFQTSGNISAFGQDAEGEIYLLDHRTGGVFRLGRQ